VRDATLTRSEPLYHGPAVNPVRPADAADAGEFAAVDRFVDGLAVEAEKVGELVDGEDVGGRRGCLVSVGRRSGEEPAIKRIRLARQSLWFRTRGKGRCAVVGCLPRWCARAGFGSRLGENPFVRQHDPSEPKHVLIDPRRSFGRPVIAGTGIPTSAVADRFFAGESPEHLAHDFRLTPDQVLEAVRYERRAAA
jgi:uncharacterized protein (DUF433 family)